jgi:formylglycine-generating enzyme required for sulfatase activity
MSRLNSKSFLQSPERHADYTPEFRRIGLLWIAVPFAGCSLSSPRPILTTLPTAASAPRIGSFQIAEKDGRVLLYVPAGEFRMGSASTERDAQSDEQSQHTATRASVTIR